MIARAALSLVEMPRVVLEYHAARRSPATLRRGGPERAAPLTALAEGAQTRMSIPAARA